MAEPDAAPLAALFDRVMARESALLKDVALVPVHDVTIVRSSSICTAGATLAAAAPSTVMYSLLLRNASLAPERMVEPGVARGTAPSAIISKAPSAKSSVTDAMSKLLCSVAHGARDAKASSVRFVILVRRRAPLKGTAVPSLNMVALSTGAASRKVPDLRSLKVSAAAFLIEAFPTVPPAEDRVTTTSEARFSRPTANEDAKGSVRTMAARMFLTRYIAEKEKNPTANDCGY